MKQFLIWLAVFILVFGGFSVGFHFHLSANPQKIFVAIDVSSYMEDVKSQIYERLSYLGESPYTQYALVTNSPNKTRKMIHTWQSSLDVSQVVSFRMLGEHDLSEMLDYPEKRNAQKVLLITHEKRNNDTGNLPGAEIILLK